MGFRHFRAFVFCFLACLVSLPVYCADAVGNDKASAGKEPFSIKTAGVPPGFQFLLEKQTTAIDVFYGDVYIATTLASYTPTTVEFHNPDEVITGLKNLVSPQQIAMGLTGEIDSHAGEVCYRDRESDCGVISPDTVGVIFDEGRFRADLFINPNLLSVQQVEFNRYLPASTTEFSVLNNLSLLYSGGDVGEDIVSLGGQSLASWYQQRVISSWDYGVVNGDDRFSADTLYWQMDQTDFQYQAGWFAGDSRFFSFVPSLNILGARYSTSFKARTDLSYAAGTPIQLYLPTRSRINIYKDGRFISTSFYDPGNQTLDTSRLPDGAYDIELRIVDSIGREERVTRYFVKTQRLPPHDQDVYFVEAGDVQTVTINSAFPKSQGIPLIQGGYGRRLAEKLGLNVGVAATDNEMLTESGLYFVSNFFDLESKILLDSNDAYGWAFNGYAHYEGWGGFYQARRVWANEPTIDEFQFIPAAFKQYAIGVNRALWEGNLQFRYSLSQRELEGTSELYSLLYGRSFTYRGSQFYFNSEITKSDTDTLVMLGIEWSLNQENVMHTVSSSLRHNEFDTGTTSDLVRLGYRGSWYDGDFAPEDVAFQWNVQADNDLTVFGASNDVRSAYGSSDVGVSYTDSEIGSGYQYSGQLFTMVGGEGSDWGVGGKNGSQGALLVEVKTDADSSVAYNLFVNNSLYGEVKGGQKILVPVAPYKTYDVRLEDKGSEYVSFGDTNRRVTIYPGNVKKLEWEGKSVGILIARIIRKKAGCFNDNDPACWEPLVFARAKGVNDVSATDGDGYIQAEVFKSAGAFTIMKRGEECRVDFSTVKFDNGLAYSEDDLKCYEMDVLSPNAP